MSHTYLGGGGLDAKVALISSAGLGNPDALKHNLILFFYEVNICWFVLFDLVELVLVCYQFQFMEFLQ